jgi:hypothetical protein
MILNINAQEFSARAKEKIVKLDFFELPLEFRTAQIL